MLVEEKLACVKSDPGKAQCARVAFEKLLQASKEGWLTPVVFDRDGNTVLHIAARCWDAKALCFLDGQV